MVGVFAVETSKEGIVVNLWVGRKVRRRLFELAIIKLAREQKYMNIHPYAKDELTV